MREAAQLRLGSLFFAYKELFSIKKHRKDLRMSEKSRIFANDFRIRG